MGRGSSLSFRGAAVGMYKPMNGENEHTFARISYNAVAIGLREFVVTAVPCPALRQNSVVQVYRGVIV